MKTGKNEEYNGILTVLSNAKVKSTEQNTSAISGEFASASDEKRSEIAINMADDMSKAVLLGVVDDNMLKQANEAVKAYPHPLLLNNYAAMCIDSNDLKTALEPSQQLQLFKILKILF